MRFFRRRRDVRTAHPPGHFYSPIVDPEVVRGQAARLWPEIAPAMAGIDMNDAAHREILEVQFPRFIAGYDYPERLPEGAPEDRYYDRNSQFGWLDSRALLVLLRAWRPRRIVEVGSGYSSLLMADVNRRWLAGECAITCIEPYPRPFLAQLPGIELVATFVQDVPLSRFAALQAGDILFIDSSHVAKTGSDVNWLFFEVLPQLASGVRIHLHDIHLPHEYPREWVVDENRSWNEQYLLRALLMHSTAFRVLFGCRYAYARWPELVAKAIALPDGSAFGGGSFWIERT
jgi:hypothetical protein